MAIHPEGQSARNRSRVTNEALVFAGVQLNGAHRLIIRKNKRHAQSGETDITLVYHCFALRNIRPGKSSRLCQVWVPHA